MLRRRKNQERGAAAVEFALVSLILITLVGVVFQFAIYLWAFQAASNGAREGARAWAVNPVRQRPTPPRWSPSSGAGRATRLVTATAAFVKGAGNIGASREPGDSVTVTVNMQARALGFNLVPGWDYNGSSPRPPPRASRTFRGARDHAAQLPEADRGSSPRRVRRRRRDGRPDVHGHPRHGRHRHRHGPGLRQARVAPERGRPGRPRRRGGPRRHHRVHAGRHRRREAVPHQQLDRPGRRPQGPRRHRPRTTRRRGRQRAT